MTKRKVYPLRVFGDDLGKTNTYWSEGHQDIDAFLEALQVEYGIDLKCAKAFVTHTYAKRLMHNNGDIWWIFGDKQVGSIPMTYLGECPTICGECPYYKPEKEEK